MEGVTQTTGSILDLVVQVILIVVPILITWFIRTYVRGSRAERDIAAITHLSNMAIDYVENLDKSGRLDVPPDVSKGLHKLNTAGEWMETELNRAGIQISQEEATRWISAEFQKRVGDVRMVGTLEKMAQQAVALIDDLERKGLITVPSEAERLLFLTDMAADWMLTQVTEEGAKVSREEAIAWVRAELLKRLDEEGQGGETLETLAARAVAFLEKLRAENRLTVTGRDVESDLVVAWMLAEAARRGLVVSSAEVAAAAREALGSAG